MTDSVLFLPMPLKYSCFDVEGCEDENKTCKAGRCVDARIDETKLPKYSEDLGRRNRRHLLQREHLLRGSRACGRRQRRRLHVRGAELAAQLAPAARGRPAEPVSEERRRRQRRGHLQRRLSREILDKDDDEGFLIPDPIGKPQQFRLTPGLCDMVRGYSTGVGMGAPPAGTPTPHRITAVRVSGTCQAKGPFQPLCAADQLVSMGVDPSGVSGNASAPAGCVATELRPPKAALVVLADDTHNSDLFYTQAAQSTIGLSLADPAFQKTELGLGFFPGPGTCARRASFTARRFRRSWRGSRRAT